MARLTFHRASIIQVIGGAFVTFREIDPLPLTV